VTDAEGGKEVHGLALVAGQAANRIVEEDQLGEIWRAEARDVKVGGSAKPAFHRMLLEGARPKIGKNGGERSTPAGVL
jgi:hypothetical protein